MNDALSFVDAAEAEAEVEVEIEEDSVSSSISVPLSFVSEAFNRATNSSISWREANTDSFPDRCISLNVALVLIVSCLVELEFIRRIKSTKLDSELSPLENRLQDGSRTGDLRFTMQLADVTGVTVVED